MQLLTGPAGSGKTLTVLTGLRAALIRKDNSVRLLVPTATMAQHLRNQMAREGFVFRPDVIQTLHRFIEPWVADLPEIAGPALHLLVEQAVCRVNPPEFSKVAHLAGFHAKLAAVLAECLAAGCDAAILRRCLPRAALGEPLVAVFAEVIRMLAERKLGLRSTRLLLAASRLDQAGTAVTIAWLDGFFSLSDAELAIVKSLAKHAEITVTLPSADITRAAREHLLAMGFEERALTHTRPAPSRELFVAPVIEREADEIARRILVETARGRRFREIGIIVRNPAVYAPVLRLTFEHFGIPARFYLDADLMEQPAVRLLAGAVDAMLAGWDHARTLVLMKLAPAVGISAAMDRFDFEVRKKLPGSGLGSLRQLAESQANNDGLLRLLDRLTELDGWLTRALKPVDWIEQFMKLRALYRPARPRDDADHELARAWRSQSAAIDAFEQAAGEAARSFDPARKIPLAEFWLAVQAVVRLTPLRVADQRRDVVHVLGVYEARQWELPVVFVCGMVEGQFPHYAAADPFLPEPARRELQQNGVRVRTAEDAEREERFLFDSAVSRATASLVLSYPRNDARGEQNLPSLFLGPIEQPALTQPVRLGPLRTHAGASRNGLRSADLLRVIQQKHAEVRPTALESYLQCPFQFFARHSLDLKEAPPRPEDRLDFRVRGSIVHKVIAEWLTTRQPVDDLFERAFREAAERDSFPAGYRTEMLRAQMLDDLRHFTRTDQWPAEFESQSEAPCQFTLDGGLGIRARIDRLLQTPDGRGFVIEYKYSPNAKDKQANEDLLQGPLYWLAIERAFHLQPAGMYYCSLRDGMAYAGWGEKLAWMGKAHVEPFTQEWLDTAMARIVRSAAEIAGGRTDPAPSDLAKCRYCDMKDVCRYETAAAVMIAEGA